jgi:hypothetical protein
MKLLLAIVIMCFSAIPTLAASLSELSWLEGSWSHTQDGFNYDETFSSPIGGVILGTTKWYNPVTGELRFFEVSSITAGTNRGDEGTLIVSPKPFGNPGVLFKAESVEQNGDLRSVEFFSSENELNKKFPSRIKFELVNQGQLLRLTVSGPDEAHVPTQVFESVKK